MSIRNHDVISWSSVKDHTASPSRIASCRNSRRRQVRPDHAARSKSKLANSYFVVNFTDYRFLQVFYPTRGILACTTLNRPEAALAGSRRSALCAYRRGLESDGKYVIFAGPSEEPISAGQKLPDHANSPMKPKSSTTSTDAFQRRQGGQPVAIEALPATA